jgi:hypothetical protein
MNRDRAASHRHRLRMRKKLAQLEGLRKASRRVPGAVRQTPWGNQAQRFSARLGSNDCLWDAVPRQPSLVGTEKTHGLGVGPRHDRGEPESIRTKRVI